MEKPVVEGPRRKWNMTNLSNKVYNTLDRRMCCCILYKVCLSLIVKHCRTVVYSIWWLEA